MNSVNTISRRWRLCSIQTSSNTSVVGPLRGVLTGAFIELSKDAFGSGCLTDGFVWVGPLFYRCGRQLEVAAFRLRRLVDVSLRA